MEKTITETEQAIKTAHRWLDDVGVDPDGDLSMLSRQFLRATEREMGLKHHLEMMLPLAKGYAHAHDVGANRKYVDQAIAYVSQITEKNWEHPTPNT